MLKQRVITAVILLAVLLATLLAPSVWPFLILLVVMAAAVMWEWLRLALPTSQHTVILPAAVVLGVLLLMFAIHLADPQPGVGATISNFLNGILVPLVALLWIVGAGVAIVRGNTAGRRYCAGTAAFGVAAVVALWFGLATLYIEYGAWFLVSLMALVWFADSIAYFAGKAIGRHKLAPAISPGKTIEGAMGGLLGAAAWMMLSGAVPGSFSAVLVQRYGIAVMLGIAVGLAALSIVGDLFESLLKRRAGIKDSSQLLPGHGGVYDRIDALFPIVPVALLLTGSA